MLGGSKLRIILVGGAVVLTAIVYFLPKGQVTAKAENSAPVEAASTGTFSFDKYISDSRNLLEGEKENQLERWEQELKKDQPHNSLFDSVSKVWDEAKNPGIAAWYFEQKAMANPAEKDWLSAAYRYFDAFKSGKDSMEAAWFAGKAIQSYSKVLELNPQNLDAKTDLGVLYAEATAEPMKGIMMLRDVVTANPSHENAQLNLGFLSMKSAQYDKALERFQKVLALNPSRIDMHIYIGESYVRMGNKEKAIENFKIFRNLSNDQQMIKDVDTYIATLQEEKTK